MFNGLTINATITSLLLLILNTLITPTQRSSFSLLTFNLLGKQMFKVNNKNTTTKFIEVALVLFLLAFKRCLPSKKTEAYLEPSQASTIDLFCD